MAISSLCERLTKLIVRWVLLFEYVLVLTPLIRPNGEKLYRLSNIILLGGQSSILNPNEREKIIRLFRL